MKKIDFSNSKVKKLFTGKGFYVALCVCLVAVMAIGYLSYRSTVDEITDTLPNPPSISQSSSDTDSDADKTTDGDVTVDGPKEQLRIMPINGDVINPFTYPHPTKIDSTNMWRTHNGVDIKASLGDPVKSIATGTVSSVKDDAKLGVTVVIDHGNGMVASYSNLNKTLSVKEGDSVSAGTVIGSIGNTSMTETSTTHLHLEVKVNNELVDPIELLQPSK